MTVHAFSDSGDGYYEVDVPEGEPLPEWTKRLTPCPVADKESAIQIANVIANAETLIDQMASRARAKYISDGVGQEATYIIKSQQADAYKASGYQGDVPPFIAAEALAIGKTPQQVTDSIISTRDAWNNVLGPAIEGLRVGSKATIRAAKSVDQVNTALESAELAFGEL